MTDTSPGNSLATRPGWSVAVPVMSDDEIERTWRIAKALAASRVFKDVTQAEQAFAKILLGRDLGLSAAQSMNAMDFVKGNVMLRSTTLAAFVKRSQYYDYHVDEHTDEKCVITFFRVVPPQMLSNRSTREVEGVSEFTIEQARAAHLVKAGGAWEAHPRNMLFARAMSNGVKWFCPDMLGGIPVYTEGDSFDSDALAIPAEAEVVTGEVVLPAAVEEVLVRAHRLGHHGLADRATAEMTLAEQPEERVMEWVLAATKELDGMDDPDELSTEREARDLLVRISEIRHLADLRREEGDNDTADELEGEADALEAEAARESG